jgi:hypothetical protein
MGAGSDRTEGAVLLRGSRLAAPGSPRVLDDLGQAAIRHYR